MKEHLNTPRVLITGALTGIGRATALAFAHEGARVVVSGRHNDEDQKLATELRKLGTEAEFVRTDVRHGTRQSALTAVIPNIRTKHYEPTPRK